MSTQYRMVQSGKTASGGCSAGPRFVMPVAPRIYFIYFKQLVAMEHNQYKRTVQQGSSNNFNLNNFKTIAAMGLKLLYRGPLEWHYLHTKFHENLPSGSEVISGGRTDRLVI
jgi:hypothetical protein